MAAWIDKAPSSQAGLVQRTRMVLVALTLAIGVSFLAGSAWLYPTRFAPWNSIGRPIESVHVPDSVHALTKQDVPVEGASPLSVDAYNALRIVQWALLLTCLALSAICVISASYVCLIHCLMMFGAVGLIFLPLLNTPSIEGLLSQRVEALDGPGTGLILQAIGASDDVQGYVQAQITVLATRKAGPGRTVLPSNSAISIVQRAGTKFRDSGRRGMSVEVLHSMEREILGHASSPPALQYERQQLARAEHYARRPQSLKSQLWGRSHRSDPGSIGAAHAQQVRPHCEPDENNRHRARRSYGHTTTRPCLISGRGTYVSMNSNE
jgi:hypothetical protein